MARRENGNDRAFPLDIEPTWKHVCPHWTLHDIIELMPFEARIRELSEELANCSDERGLKIALELQTLIHERIEQLRSKLDGLPLLSASATCSGCARTVSKNENHLCDFDKDDKALLAG
jgi:hypothetical protein